MLRVSPLQTRTNVNNYSLGFVSPVKTQNGDINARAGALSAP